VIASALLFGVFHEVIFPGRLLTSTFLGLVLGWVRMRTGSILPGMLLHMVHNGVLLSMPYWSEKLIAGRWGIEDQVHLPPQWLALSMLGILMGAALLIGATRQPSRDTSTMASSESTALPHQ
jgi:ABC-2 type transport system permease protein/sodium transport system permease protein